MSNLPLKPLLSLVACLCSSNSLAQQCEYPIVDLSACQRRTERAGHTPTVNGCGPEGSSLKFPQGVGLADFTAPCNAHDVCYETCNSDKARCDAALAETARAECLRAYPRPAPGVEDEAWGSRATCMSRARKYGSAVSAFGKAAYEAAQKLACECCTGLPEGYTGTLTYHLKLGGPSTSVLPLELRYEAQVTLRRSGNSRSYELVAGAATLIRYDTESGVTNCQCSAMNVVGTVESETGALILEGDAIGTLQWSSIINTPLVCTGSTDPSCANASTLVAVAFSLTGMNPACTNASQLGFSDPRLIEGSWRTSCPANPQLLGRVEEVSWALRGTD